VTADESSLYYLPPFEGEKRARLTGLKAVLMSKSQRGWEGEVPHASLRSWQTTRWCVAERAIPFGPICARVILFSTIANYNHLPKKSARKSLSRRGKARWSLLIQSQWYSVALAGQMDVSVCDGWPLCLSDCVIRLQRRRTRIDKTRATRFSPPTREVLRN